MKASNPFSQINDYPKFFEAIKQGEKLLVLEDKVINVGLFASEHPGGEAIMNDYIGCEISRYFYGAHQNPQAKEHTHKEPAYNRVKEYQVARIENPLKYQIFFLQ